MCRVVSYTAQNNTFIATYYITCMINKTENNRWEAPDKLPSSQLLELLYHLIFKSENKEIVDGRKERKKLIGKVNDDLDLLTKSLSADL